MNAIELMMDEHRKIERGLDALEAMGRRAAANEPLEPADLGRLAGLIRALADERHHGKEEAILFEAMVKHGFPREAGPIAVMLMEHDEGRAYVGSLRELGEKTEWSEKDREAASLAAEGFTGLLRAHIEKEDQALYPMAQAHLPAWAMDEVDERCRFFEEDWERSGKASWGDLEAIAGRYVVMS